MMEIVFEEAKKTSVFHLALGLYFFSMQRTSVWAVHGSSSKVSTSKDYILLCILVFDRAAPLCPTVHCPTLYCTPLSQASSQSRISFKKSVEVSVENVLAINSRKQENYNINTDNNYSPTCTSWLIYNIMGSDVGPTVRWGAHLGRSWIRGDSHNLCYLQLWLLLLYLGIITKCTSRSLVHCYPSSNSEIIEG